MAEVMTENKPTVDAAAAATESDASGRSPTGYEAFLADSSVHLKEIMDKAPSPKVLTERAQSMITSFFPPEEKSIEQTLSVETEAIVSKDPAGEDAPPELTASSSSEGSKSNKEEKQAEKELSWSEKLCSTCQMDTACGRLELEITKEQASPSKAHALTEQGELLQIEGAPQPKAWTRQVSDATADTMKSVSTKATGLMVALGLATKKDQGLITDYFKVKETPKEPEKSLSEKVQQLQSNVTTSAKNLLGMGAQEKVKKMNQTLITDYDPSKAKQEDATVEKRSDAVEDKQEDATVDESISVRTENKTVAPQEKKSLWTRVKDFFGRAKIETPSCPNVEVPSSFPEIKLPECTNIQDIKTPKIEIPSITLLSCNPNAATEAEKTEEPKKVEPLHSPSHNPW